MNAPMNASVNAPMKRHRLSVSEYYAMARHGILAQDARVELIDGEIIDMAPIGISHASIVSLLTGRLARATGDDIVISPQNPVRLSDFSEPQPDLSLLRPRVDGYPTVHPSADEVVLMIEVAHSSLAYDRDVKLPLYARHGVPVVWLVDVAAQGLTIHARPDGECYTLVEAVQDLVAVPVGVLDGVTVDLSGLFA